MSYSFSRSPLGWLAGSAGGYGRALGRRAEVFPVKSQHVLPGIRCLHRSVARPIHGEEAVAGAVVAVELVVLAESFELSFGSVDIGWRWPLVVIPEDAEQRAADVLRQVDRRHGLAR